MVAEWETLSKDLIGDFKIFDLYKVRRLHPIWKKEGEFVILESPQWVNIIPVTADGNVILIEQYRHGTDELTLEVPGGLVEPGEAPRLAAERECLEETGFTGSGPAELLGENLPNPAFLNNKCYSYLWTGCKKKSGQSLDGNEEITLVETPLDKIKELILNKKIQHSLVLTAFFFYFIKYNPR